MTIEADFRATLAAHAPLTALVGSRIALNAIDAPGMPCVVFAASHDRTIGLNNTLLADQCAIEVQCWADTAAGADAVADAVIAAVATASAAAGACVLSRASSFDAELGIDSTVLAVEWWA